MHGQPLPRNEHDLPSHQNNAYGWSKPVNECQFINSKINKTVGLRFFTVYVPYSRPDMALILFADAIPQGKDITLYNYGDMNVISRIWMISFMASAVWSTDSET